MISFRASFWCLFLLLFSIPSRSQNLVQFVDDETTLPPALVGQTQVAECIWRFPNFGGSFSSREALRIQHKMRRHVASFLQHARWMPFHHTLGISGYDVYFNHPDEAFYSLSITLPFLPPEERTLLQDYLVQELQRFPPYTIDGYDHQQGQPRESYQVPSHLRIPGRGKAQNAFGVYAFWAFSHFSTNKEIQKSHWPAIQARIKPLLESPYSFNPGYSDYSNDEPEKLNGDLAGLIGYVRLAKANQDALAVRRGVEAARDLLQMRLNLERINPHILQRSRATRSLHLQKLSRFCSLVPEVADFLEKNTEGIASRRIQRFREERNAWYLAFGDRFIGGENYTNPPHFPRSLFTTATFFEKLGPDTLLAFVDVPWCQGDLYFLERCVYALWAANGREWQTF